MKRIFLLALFLPAFTLPFLLTGCNQPVPLSSKDVDRIAERAAELVRSDLERTRKEIQQSMQASLQKAVKELKQGTSKAKPVKVIMAPPVQVSMGKAVSATPPKPALTKIPVAKSPVKAPVAKAPSTKVKPPTPAPPPTSGQVNIVDRTGGVPQQDPLLARIGDEEIRLSDFQRLVEQNQRLKQQDPKVVLDNLVHFRLMARAARASGLLEKNEDLRIQIKDRLDEFRYELLVRDTVEAAKGVTEDEIVEYYKANQDTYTTPATIQIHEITTKTKEEAEELLKKLTKENFSETAKEASLSATKRRGGNMGKITKERFPKAQWNTLLEAAEGDIVGPFKSTSDIYGLYLRGALTEAKVQPLETVKDRIINILTRKNRDKTIASLRAQAEAVWPLKVYQEDPSKATRPEELLFTIGSGRFTLLDFENALKNAAPRQAFQWRTPQGKPLFLKRLEERSLLSNLAKTNADFMTKRRSFLKDVERQLLINRFAQDEIYAGVKVTDAEVKARYEADKERFKTPKERSIKARHILVRVTPDAKETDQDLAKDKIMAALERIQDGEDFASVAKQVSEGPTGPRGGDLGNFGPGRMVPPFDKALQGLQGWQVTQEPVRTRFGFHLILREPTPAYLSFTEVRANLKQGLFQQKQAQAVQSFLAQLASKNKIETFPEQLPVKAPPPPKKQIPAANGKQQLRFEMRDGKLVPIKG
jgi:parvulin-like peptidyl-prolyl isomerase